MIRYYYRLDQRLRELALKGAFPEIEDPVKRRITLAYWSLPKLHREVFRLARFEDLSDEQIGVRLGLSTERARGYFLEGFRMLCRSVDRQERKDW